MTTTKPRPETVGELEVRRAREQFEEFVTDHKMTVLLDTLDDGTPYRHIRFAKPGTNMWSFNLVTWPGHLSIGGDLESFTFRRLHDMFAFFRGSVNPGYWGEKIVAGTVGTDHGETRYSRDRFVEAVREQVSWVQDDLPAGDFKKLQAAIDRDLIDDPPEYLEDALERLNEFAWDSDNPSAGGFRFYDVYDMGLGGYDHHFLLSCHAIQWGVRTYLAAHPDRFIPEGQAK